MLLRQLKYFVSVVKNNSFTIAAEECYISQSAISQQIHSLEADLGTQLIIRENRSFTLTPAGDYLYHQGILLLDEAERLRSETIRIGGNGNTVIKIGYLNGYTGHELSNAISDFAELYPDVDINITTGNHEELRDLILADKADILLSDQRRAFSDEYNNFHLYTCLCYIEISTRSPIASLEKVTVDELKRIPCILISSKEQRNIEQEFYQSYLGFSGNFLFAENIEEARLLVAANKGFLPVQITQNNKEHNTVSFGRVALFKGDKQVERSYYAFWKKQRSTPEIEKFADILYDKFS